MVRISSGRRQQPAGLRIDHLISASHIFISSHLISPPLISSHLIISSHHLISSYHIIISSLSLGGSFSTGSLLGWSRGSWVGLGLPFLSQQSCRNLTPNSSYSFPKNNLPSRVAHPSLACRAEIDLWRSMAAQGGARRAEDATKTFQDTSCSSPRIPGNCLQTTQTEDTPWGWSGSLWFSRFLWFSFVFLGFCFFFFPRILESVFLLAVSLDSGVTVPY